MCLCKEVCLFENRKLGSKLGSIAKNAGTNGSYNSVTNATSVKQDLIISCYKPSSEFESIYSDATELIKLITSIIKTTKSNIKN